MSHLCLALLNLSFPSGLAIGTLGILCLFVSLSCPEVQVRYMSKGSISADPFAPQTLLCFLTTMDQSDSQQENAACLEFVALELAICYLAIHRNYSCWVSQVPVSSLCACYALGPRRDCSLCSSQCCLHQSILVGLPHISIISRSSIA